MASRGNSNKREDAINLRLLVNANDNDPEHQVHIAHMSPLTHYGSFVHHEPHATYTTDDAYFILPSGQQNEAPNYLNAAKDYDYYNNNNNNHIKKISSPTMRPIAVKKNNKSRIRNFTLGLIVFLSIVCVVWWLNYRKNASINNTQKQSSRLIMVNVFNRHGDRSPGSMRMVDSNAARQDQYWPNGLGNLTTVGKMRQFRVGLKLRQIYDEYLGYDASNLLTFTSPMIRCQESLKFTLMGLYDIEQEASQGLAQLKQVANCSAHQQCLSPGSGLPNEWKKVKFDTNSVKSLTYDFLNKCSYRKKNPPAMDNDLMIVPLIRTMPGVERLKVVIKETFGIDFNFTALDLWGTVACELQLHRTQSTIADERHSGWVNEIVPTNRPDIVVNLYQIYESVAAICYLLRVEGTSRYIQAGPMITSVVESQIVALNENGRKQNHTIRPSPSIYSGKKMVIYSSHDSVIQIMLHSLGIIRIAENFEDRYDRGKGSDTAGLASGMKMPNYGFSLRIELWNLELEPAPDYLLDSVKVFTIVKASIYNDAQAKYGSIDYEPVQFGSICRILFKEKYPNASEADLESFYDRNFDFDHNLACPFNLFHHLMTEWLIDDAELKQLCE